MSETRSLSVRMPLELMQRLSVKGRTSRYIVEAVKEKLDRDERAEIEASLLCLADDSEANDISDLKSAQTKVMNRAD